MRSPENKLTHTEFHDDDAILHYINIEAKNIENQKKNEKKMEQKRFFSFMRNAFSHFMEKIRCCKQFPIIYRSQTISTNTFLFLLSGKRI